MRQLIQSTVAMLAISGAAATAFGGVISSVTVTPARPTQDAVVTWDASPNYTAYGAAWTNSDSSRSDPGQSFLMPQNASVGSVAVRLTTANIGGNPLVQNANGEPIIVSLETYTDGTDFVPDGTVASYTGNLPNDFETSASNPGDWITFTFDQTAALTAGNYYGIRLEFANAGANLHRIFLEIRGEVTPVYDGMTSMYLGAGYQNYNGNQYPMGFVVMAPVPEPASIGMLGLLGTGLLARRRR